MAHQRQASASLAHQRNASGHLRQRHGSDSFRTDDLKSGRRSIADRRSSRADGSYIADDDTEFHDGPVREEDEERDDYEDDWKVAAAENGSLPKSKKHMRQMSTSTAFEQRPNSLSRQRSDPRAPTLAAVNHGEISTPPPPAPTWMNMPNKGQLAILAASRFVDFFQMAALQTYMVHQLRSFDPELSDGTISHQAGMLQGAFTAAQIVTSILWGRAADQPSVGRKLVLNIGLVGTAFGCIGVAFSTTFAQAVFWRVVSGAINGTVGSARTMVAERTPKPWHPRAFLLLPAAFNVANVAGPILSGILSEPLENFPHLFAEGSTFGGPDGVKWMKKYPYALPNLLCTVLLLAEAVLVHYGLDETLKGKRRFEPIRFLRETYANFKDAKAHGYRKLQEVYFGAQRLPRAGTLAFKRRKGRLDAHRAKACIQTHLDAKRPLDSPQHRHLRLPHGRFLQPLDPLPRHSTRVRARKCTRRLPPLTTQCLQICLRPGLPTAHHRLRNGHHRLHRRCATVPALSLGKLTLRPNALLPGLAHPLPGRLLPGAIHRTPTVHLARS
jgi:MFS family permease